MVPKVWLWDIIPQDGSFTNPTPTFCCLKTPNTSTSAQRNRLFSCLPTYLDQREDRPAKPNVVFMIVLGLYFSDREGGKQLATASKYQFPEQMNGSG